MASLSRTAKHVIWWACLLVCLQHSCTAITHSEYSRKEQVGVPGCRLTTSQYPPGKKLTCINADFRKIVQYMKNIGNNLAELDIAHCLPSTAMEINSATFAATPELKEITIQYNCAFGRFAPNSFEKLSRLLKLVLSSNNMTSIFPGAFTGLHSLHSLEISMSQISLIDGNIFKGLPSLVDLSLACNKIAILKRGSFSGLRNLTSLVLTANMIESIENGAFEGLKELKILDLSKNKYLKLEDGSLTGISNLKKIDLSWNTNLFSLSSFGFLNGLTQLNLVDPQGVDLSATSWMKKLPMYFHYQINSLTHLDLSKTHFNNELLPMIQSLKNVQELHLGDNDLGFILKTSLPKLTAGGCVFLRDNKILYVENAFSGMKGVVYLKGNPIYCDCTLRSFAKFLRSDKGRIINDAEHLTCGGPHNIYRTRLIDYNPDWWTCSPYIPYIALAFVIGFCLLVVLAVVIIWCNWVNIKYCFLERRELAKANEQRDVNGSNPERRALVSGLAGVSTLPKDCDKTGAFILYNMHDPATLAWVNQYIEEKLYNHSMRITLQWSAGNDFIPLWKQVKNHGFDVQKFLVVCTDDFVTNYWPEISEKSGYENLTKFVLVLFDRKQKDLPRDLRRLRCPVVEWPLMIGRKRTYFWKQVHLALKGVQE